MCSCLIWHKLAWPTVTARETLTATYRVPWCTWRTPLPSGICFAGNHSRKSPANLRSHTDLFSAAKLGAGGFEFFQTMIDEAEELRQLQHKLHWMMLQFFAEVGLQRGPAPTTRSGSLPEYGQDLPKHVRNMPPSSINIRNHSSQDSPLEAAGGKQRDTVVASVKHLWTGENKNTGFNNLPVVTQV